MGARAYHVSRERGQSVEGQDDPILGTHPSVQLHAHFKEKRGGNDADDAGFRVAPESRTGGPSRLQREQRARIQPLCSMQHHDVSLSQALNPTAMMPVARIVVHLESYWQECSASCRSYEFLRVTSSPADQMTPQISPHMRFMSLLVLCGYFRLVGGRSDPASLRWLQK